MITEDYVGFETAKLLKEKGFVKFPYACFTHDGVGLCGYVGTSSDIMRPTLQMAMKWLREVHKLPINVWYDKEDDTLDEEVWRSEVAVDKPSYILVGSFSTYEEACEAAIKYCLENLI